MIHLFHIETKTSINFILIFMIAVFITLPAYAVEGKTFSIPMNEISAAHYHKDNGNMSLRFDKKIWLKLREFTTGELNRRITLEIGNSFVFHPTVFSAIDSGCVLYMTNPQADKFLKMYNKTRHSHATYSKEDRIEFLETWMKTHPLDSNAFSETIRMYHDLNNVSACQKAIDYYEDYPHQSIKQHLSDNAYFQLTGCYVKTDHKKKALSFLQSSVNKIYPDSRWWAYEYLGDISVETKQRKKALAYYQNALESFDEYFKRTEEDVSSLHQQGSEVLLDKLKTYRDQIESKINSIKS